MSNFAITSSMLMRPRRTPQSAWLGHIPFASWLLDALRPASVVELGTHRGASFLAFCQAVEEQGLSCRVFAVDSWEGDDHAGYYGDQVYLELRDYQQRHYAGISEMMRMRFNQAVEYFEDGSVDLLHIDGLHTYDAAREDFESWLPKLSSKGVVLFHDICVREREFGVWRLWDELQSRYPSFSFPHTHGLGVLLVGTDRCQDLLQLAGRAAEGGFSLVNRVFDALGQNIKSIEEIERVNDGLAAAHREIGRLADRERILEAEIQGLRQTLDDHQAVVTGAQHELGQAQALAGEKITSLMERIEELNAHSTRVAADAVARVIAQMGDGATQLHGQVESLRGELVGWVESLRGELVGRVESLQVEMSDAASRSEGVLMEELRNAQARLDRLLLPWWRRNAGH